MPALFLSIGSRRLAVPFFRNEPAMGVKGDARRKMLLEAALHLFSSHGYEGATTKAIAEIANVSEPTLFRYFRSKQELYEAVVSEYGPGEVFRGPSGHGREAPVEEVLRKVIVAYMDGVWENRGFVRMMIMGQLSNREAQTKEARIDEGRRYLETLLAQRSQRGEIQPGLAQPAADVISAAVSGFLLRVTIHEPADWPAARDEFVKRLLVTLFGGLKA